MVVRIRRTASGVEPRSASRTDLGDVHLALIAGLKTQSANARAEMDKEVSTVALHRGVAQVRSRQ